MTRREYAGGAAPLTLSGSIGTGDTSITTTGNATGWPTGGVGKFMVVIDRGLATEEKILVNARTDNVLTLASADDRGADDTSAAEHLSGAVLEHVVGAMDLDEPNEHINDTTEDHHTQYMMADGTRHDLQGRHTFDNALGSRPAVVSTGDANSTGTAESPAAGDHVHKGVVANEAWTDWTPTMIQNGALTISIVRAKWMRLGRMIHAFAVINIDGAGTAGHHIQVQALPVAAAYTVALTNNLALPVGTGLYTNLGSVGFIHLMPYFVGATTLAFMGVSPAETVVGFLGNSGGMALAAGTDDTITFSVSYEAAS